jgi:hypothetical protein
MVSTIALGLPHTPWVPERVDSFDRLLSDLHIVDHDGDTDEEGLPSCSGTEPLDHGKCGPSDGPTWAHIFSDRESNKVWPIKMWRWGLETKADFFLTLQDDVIIAPNFWPALRAMLKAVPDQVIGLSAVAPGGPEIARQGHRFYATRSHLVGWAYAMPRALLAEFVAWVDANPKNHAEMNEDQLLNEFVCATGKTTWHPVPTIVDHDVSIESTYGNDDHTHRRATVTWRAYSEADLEDPLFWAHNGNPPLLACPPPQACSWCAKNAAVIRSTTGALMCRVCIATLALGLMGVRPQP